jgi:hypothetical protein
MALGPNGVCGFLSGLMGYASNLESRSQVFSAPGSWELPGRAVARLRQSQRCLPWAASSAGCIG